MYRPIDRLYLRVLYSIAYIIKFTAAIDIDLLSSIDVFFFCHFFFCVTIFLLNVCSCRKIVKFSESHVKWIIVRTRAQVHKRINDFIDDLKENIFFVWIVCWTYIRRVRIVDGPGSMQFLAKLSNGFMQMQHLTIIFLFFLDFICRNVVALFRLWNAHTAVPSSNR